MTEQQEHLKRLLEQQQELVNLIESKRSLLLRCQGAIEYLTQIGVTLPETSDQVEETVEETVEDGE